MSLQGADRQQLRIAGNSNGWATSTPPYTPYRTTEGPTGIIHDYDGTRSRATWSALRKDSGPHEVQKDSLGYGAVMHLPCHISLYRVCRQYAPSL